MTRWMVFVCYLGLIGRFAWRFGSPDSLAQTCFRSRQGLCWRKWAASRSLRVPKGSSYPEKKDFAPHRFEQSPRFLREFEGPGTHCDSVRGSCKDKSKPCSAGSKFIKSSRKEASDMDHTRILVKKSPHPLPPDRKKGPSWVPTWKKWVHNGSLVKVPWRKTSKTLWPIPPILPRVPNLATCLSCFFFFSLSELDRSHVRGSSESREQRHSSSEIPSGRGGNHLETWTGRTVGVFAAGIFLQTCMTAWPSRTLGCEHGRERPIKRGNHSFLPYGQAIQHHPVVIRRHESQPNKL